MKPIPQVSRHDPVRIATGTACGQLVAPGQWQCQLQYLPHSGQLMAAIKMLSTKHLPHWHLLAEKRTNSNHNEEDVEHARGKCPGAKLDAILEMSSPGQNWTPPFEVAAAVMRKLIPVII